MNAGLPELEVSGVVDEATIAAIGAFEAAQGVFPSGMLHLVIDEPEALAQGQVEGDTLKEACVAAREACKAEAACPPDDATIFHDLDDEWDGDGETGVTQEILLRSLEVEMRSYLHLLY
jgi:hypothetical protein